MNQEPTTELKVALAIASTVTLWMTRGKIAAKIIYGCLEAWCFLRRLALKKRSLSMETKAASWAVEGSTLVISVDLNKDGQPLLTVRLEMAEIPDEVLSAIMKKKGA